MNGPEATGDEASLESQIVVNAVVTEGSDDKCEVKNGRIEEVHEPRKTSTKAAGFGAETSEPKREVTNKKTSKDRRPLRVGPPTDLKIGGQKHNVLIKQGRLRSERLMRRSRTVGIAPECKTLSKARDIPIPGAKIQPKRLRSKKFVLGFPKLRGRLLNKVQKGNRMAKWSLKSAIDIHKQRRGVWVENPGNSYMWDFEEAKEFAGLPGVTSALFHNCMHGGRKRKLTRIDTNMEPVAKRLRTNGWCYENNGVCDRTGLPHESFRPDVDAQGGITFKTEEEAEYPRDMAELIAEGTVEFLETEYKKDKDSVDFDFVEVFSGLNAPTSQAMKSKEVALSLDVNEAEAKTETSGVQSWWEHQEELDDKNKEIVKAVSQGTVEPGTVKKLVDSQRKAVGAKQPEMAKVGRFENVLVRADEAKIPVEVRGPASAKSLKPTKKEKRDVENAQCIGGMRTPWRSTRRLPMVREVGKQIRIIIEDFISKDEDIAGLYKKFGDKEFDTPDSSSSKWLWSRVKDLRAKIKDFLEAENVSSAPRTRWEASVVQAHIKKSQDPDVDFGRWLEEGAPVGILHPLRHCGIFPKIDEEKRPMNELEEIMTSKMPGANYKSIEEEKENVRPEFDRVISAGYARRFRSWDEVVKVYGEVAVAKAACVVKQREDGTLKLRIIIDWLRANLNEFVKREERCVLPRLKDFVLDVLELLDTAYANNEEVRMLIADVEDAFHTLGIRKDERKFQIVRGLDGEFIGYETVLFGGGASPGVWGRGAAYLGRSGQSLFDEKELRVEVFVDDPAIVARGSSETECSRRMTVLLLWWMVLGLRLSWKKMEFGSQIHWIGTSISIVDRRRVKVELTETFCDKVKKANQEIMKAEDATVKTIIAHAGSVGWAAGIAPVLAGHVAGLWAAAGLVRRLYAKTREAQRAKLRFEKKKIILMKKEDELKVPGKCIKHCLEWIDVFLARKRGKLSKEFRMEKPWCRRQLEITSDASPWGFGAWLGDHGVPVEYLHGTWTEDDFKRMETSVGDCRGQAKEEALAVLIAARTWLPLFQHEVIEFVMKSDSKAALGALNKAKSKERFINIVARELALDLAECEIEPTLRLVHITGKSNTWADILSKLGIPGAGQQVPWELSRLRRRPVAARSSEWWETC